MRIYFDHNATTPILPAARAAMLRALEELPGNPSSIHDEGRQARQALELARDQVARLCGGAAEEIVFTSGGTEADQLAVRAALATGRRRLVTSPLEHPAVLGAVRALGLEVTLVPVGADGMIDPDALERVLGADVALVTLQLANHELGNLFPVAALAERAHAHGALFHTDAVQAAGKIPLSVGGIDLMSISAHKLGGGKGVGALWVRRGVELSPPSSSLGGHQERGRRPGTENLAGIVGFGAAAELARTLAHAEEVRRLRDRLESGAIKLGAQRNGHSTARVGNTTNLAWEGVPGDLLVAALDLEGVAASTGAACTSGSVEPSPVLLALGQDRVRAASGLRLSLGAGNTEAEVDRVLALLPMLVERIRRA